MTYREGDLYMDASSEVHISVEYSGEGSIILAVSHGYEVSSTYITTMPSRFSAVSLWHEVSSINSATCHFIFLLLASGMKCLPPTV